MDINEVQITRIVANGVSDGLRDAGITPEYTHAMMEILQEILARIREIPGR